MHAGFQLLPADIRNANWPSLDRNLARANVRKCITFIRFKAENIPHIKGNLPNTRTIQCSLFSVTGVDYARSLPIKNRKM